MKNILLSIHTKYVKEILMGNKHFELRGWIYQQDVKYIYIYSSNINKKIVARFEPINIIKGTPEEVWSIVNSQSGVNKEEYFAYVNTFNYEIIYAIEISKLEILDTYLNPTQIFKNFKAPQRFKYLNENENQVLEGFFK